MNILTLIHAVVAIAIIVLILLQERSAGVSGIFGGSEGGFYQTRRGIEKTFFIATIVLIGVFAVISLVSLVR